MAKQGRVSGKKRKKGFRGIQKQNMPDRVESRAQDDHEEESNRPSASKSKIGPAPAPKGFTSGTSAVLLRSRSTSSASDGGEAGPSELGSVELSGNCVVSCESLVSLLSNLRHCPRRAVSVSEDRATFRGMVTRMKVECECGWFQYLTVAIPEVKMGVFTPVRCITSMKPSLKDSKSNKPSNIIYQMNPYASENLTI